MNKLPVWAIARLRMATDGTGVTTLVTAAGCPLRCKYCINPHSWNGAAKTELLTAEALYGRVKIDDLYFQATNGGVTFGGGEPLQYAPFLPEFRALCGDKWRLYAETSLNVSEENVRVAAEALDGFIVDIKDTDPAIYRNYTGCENERVMRNLSFILEKLGPERITVRIPLIPEYNTEDDVRSSAALLTKMGFTKLDIFPYIIR